MNSKFFQNGLFGIAALAGIGIFMGSVQESNSQKFGLIARDKISQQSKYIMSKSMDLEQKMRLRMDFYHFLEANKTVNKDQAKTLIDLIIKAETDKTAQEKADKLKEEFQAAQKEYLDLSQKQSPTEQEKEKLKEYSKVVSNSQNLLKEFQRHFQEEFKVLEEQMSLEINKKMQEACAKVAQSKGFTLVYDTSAVVYSPNDLTEEAIKELDKQK